MAERRLRLSDDLALPLEFATEGVAVIGKRGSGKSNTEARFVELLYEAGVPFAVIDPKGDWYGLKSSRDGKAKGLAVPVFGGLYGDFPLDERTGARIADLLVDEMLSAVLDVSHLSKTGGLPTFLTAFCNQLMHRHQLEPHVRTVILEEAHRYIPQSVTAKSATLKEAAAAVLLEGRAFGLGCWAATQRPARLHKDVLEEVGAAIIHAIGVSATNDKRTIAGWVDHHDISKEIVDSLTVLRPGEAWVLIPQDGLVQRVQMQRRTTFDSAATPKVGQAPRRPSTMADIDQAAITKALEDVITRAKQDDPKELRARIRELEREAAQRPAEQVTETVVERIEVPVLNGEVDRLEEAIGRLSTVGSSLAQAGIHIGGIAKEIVGVADDLQGALRRVSGAPAPVQQQPRRIPREAPPRPVAAVSAPPAAEVAIGRGERTILIAVAQYPEGATRDQLSVLTGYKRSSRDTYLQRLSSAGYVEAVAGGWVRPTDAGIAALGSDYEPLPQGEALQDYWRAKLPEGERRVLDVLVAAYPDAVPREQIDEQTGYKRSSRDTYLQRLRSRRLVENVGSGQVRASEDLF